MKLIRTLVLAAATAALLAPSASAQTQRPFAPTSFWNAPLAADAPLDPDSTLLLNDLGRQFGLGTPWINTNEYSTPVYEVPRNQKTVRVALDNAASVDPWLQAAWEKVPLPTTAKPAAGTDGTLVVWQPSTDTMWEFWRLRKNSAGQWQAAYGGRMTNVSTNEGRFTQPAAWGASATSLPWIGGLMRLNELKAGKIDHALAMAIPDARAGTWSWPAQRTDGRSVLPTALPLGTRLRVNPSVNVAALNIHPVAKMMALAAQKYGIVIRDTADSVAFYAEDSPGNPYYGPGGVFGGAYPNQILSQFPWYAVQVLKTDMRTVPGQ